MHGQDEWDERDREEGRTDETQEPRAVGEIIIEVKKVELKKVIPV